MFRLIVVSAMIFSCAIEEDNSSDISAWAKDNKQVGDAPVSIEQADVNKDGVIDITDLTAVSYWFGETVEGKGSQVVERVVKSSLLEDSTIEVGKFFSIYLTADLAGGTEYPAPLAPDFVDSNGNHDKSCEITAELQAIDDEGQVIDDAFVLMVAEFDESIHQTSVRVNNVDHYSANVHGGFADSALTNNVAQLVVKSGSVCKNKNTQMMEVKRIPVKVAKRSSTTTLEAEINGVGALRLIFTPPLAFLSSSNEDSGYVLRAMIVDKNGLLRGFFDSDSGTITRRDGRSRFIKPSIGVASFKQKFAYQINGFKRDSEWEMGNDKAEICSDGDRAFVFIQETRFTKRGDETFYEEVEGSGQIYESLCIIE